ncbi:M15 family metallopeptidase [Novilysobacter antarcticus]|uniref:M15 family metallopeptidase n=1 Tax=Novilysobacter antarcticus TaxID=2862543 RepID=UPI001FE87D1F|nr:M15 family metallopeptidase [Lysobacter antarcticus]
MLALGMAVFFLLTVLLGWLAVFPAARDVVLAGVGRWRARMSAVAGRWQAGAGARACGSSRALRGGSVRLGQMLHRGRWLLAATIAALLLPPLLVLQFGRQVMWEDFGGGAGFVADSHVVQLLRGERLAPPPDLPPAVFLAAEAAQLQGNAVVAPREISSADRKWVRIAPDFQQRVLAIYRVMREVHGYEMVLVEGYRSPERQAALAAKGGAVTQAGAGQSCHQYGLAVDSALYRDGKLQWDMEDPWTRRGYFLYGQLAVEAGLEWGGNWRSIKDYVHLELKSDCRQARRAAGR